MTYIIVAIIGVILFFVFIDMSVKHSDQRFWAKVQKKRKEIIDSVGEFEGKSLNEIKDNLGEPSNVEILNDKRIITWQALGLKIMCNNQDPIVCEEVLVNRFGNK